MNRIVVSVMALFLASCASDSASVRPSRSELIGTYFLGDGIGPGEELVLHNDGTFSSTIGGDLITTSLTSSGTWTLDGDRVTFHDKGIKPGVKPAHTFAITQMYKNKLVLIRGEDAREDKVFIDFVYRKQPEK